MRLISFAMTKPQILAQTKTVTRRTGWATLRAGTLLQPVDRVMGFRAPQKPKHLGPPIRVVSVRRERLDAITAEDVEREGMPGVSPQEFVSVFCRAMRMRCLPSQIVTRIEFGYLEPRDAGIKEMGTQ